MGPWLLRRSEPLPCQETHVASALLKLITVHSTASVVELVRLACAQRTAQAALLGFHTVELSCFRTMSSRGGDTNTNVRADRFVSVDVAGNNFSMPFR
jgi:hypothetical protein